MQEILQRNNCQASDHSFFMFRFIINLRLMEKQIFRVITYMMMGLAQLPPEVFKHWIQSREDIDNRKNVSVFRPSDYPFPPSRGRRGFEIKRNGVFILHEIGRTDRPVKLVGKYTVDGPDGIKVYLEDRNPFILKIIAIEDDGRILRVERV